MSQPLSHIPTPLATAVWDWLAVPDSANQSNSNNDEAVTKAKYNERQHWKKREVAELHRWEEAEHQEREENECQEREANKHWEREAWAQAASQVRGAGLQSHDLVAEVKCTYELANAGKCGKKSCDWCSSTKEQCVLVSTKKVQKCIVMEESTSPRASEKKKCARAKSPEVEIVGGSSQSEKGKGVAHDTLITRGLYAIAKAIDQHTKEMAQLQQMVKSLGSSHHHMIESMAELLQEMTYPVLELPAESGSEGSTVETLGDTNAKGEPDKSETLDE
ncbi:hypothetical protein EDD16DRAFT_1521944 [Pisolithus croceorrhizus]|nr:hypothetical protein EDD16DRAFT_1521944 [Pisolithus croceorrhizus]KAI6119278.1 hypothetical protein EV401DRAFT_1888265 [Pisolithus croceorrhizus]KAI6165115.1 hypothetical protein EDD17DRAFT_1505999 [Pisolithus thermaeus]